MDDNEKMLREAVDDLYNAFPREEVSNLLNMMSEMTGEELQEFIEESLAKFDERDAKKAHL